MRRSEAPPKSGAHVVALAALLVASVLFCAAHVPSAAGPPLDQGRALASEPGVVRNLRRVAWWPYGTCYDVAYDPSSCVLVAGSGGTILLLDVSDLSQPRKVSDLVLQGQATHIELSQHIAYVTTYRRDGLQIVDVSHPAQPYTLGFYAAQGNAHGIEIVGHIAYLAAGESLDIVDVSNPVLPRLEGRYPVAGRATHTAVRGDKLYLEVWSEGMHPSSSGSGGIHVLDISNPAAPRQLGFYPAPNLAHFAVLGSTGLLAEWGSHTLHVLDLADDAAFSEVSTLDLLDETHNAAGVVVDIEFLGSLAFISGEFWDHLQVVDVSDPRHPVVVGSVNAEQSTIDRGQYYIGAGPITLAGNLLFQAAWTCGVGIFDISQPLAPRVVRTWDTPDPYSDVCISGNIACIANCSDGLRLLDISDPLHMREIGSLSPGLAAGTFFQVVCPAGRYAFAATEGCGLQVFDITLPDSPHRVSVADTPGIARGIAVSEGYAYLADSEGGLRIMDVRLPDSPFEVGSCLFGASTTRVAVSNGYAYVGTEDGYLQIVDVSSPASPQFHGALPIPGTPDWITSLTTAGNELYLGTNAGFVHRLDITDPLSPQLKSSLALPGDGPLEDVVVAQGRLYVVGVPFGLHVLDVTDPVDMAEVAYDQAPGPARGVDVAGGHIYVACDDAGLLVLTPDRSLSIDHPRGAPGSYFNVSVDGLPPRQPASVTVNSRLLGAVLASAGGTFTFTLATSSAEEGFYHVVAGANPATTARLTLDAAAPLWPQEGDYPVYELPARIGYAAELYLPLVGVGE
jgi:hypothetical protein